MSYNTRFVAHSTYQLSSYGYYGRGNLAMNFFYKSIENEKKNIENLYTICMCICCVFFFFLFVYNRVKRVCIVAENIVTVHVPTVLEDRQVE